MQCSNRHIPRQYHLSRFKNFLKSPNNIKSIAYYLVVLKGYKNSVVSQTTNNNDLYIKRDDFFYLGTCFPDPVSEKKVLKESSPPPIVLSEGIWPSG